MWNNTIKVLIVFAALVSLNSAQRGQQRNNEYLPPSNEYLPVREDPNNIGDANSDNSVFLKPDVQEDTGVETNLENETVDVAAPAENHDHGHDHHDHDHHHEHWDLRESIPGEPGQDYPLHYSVPETKFSCAGRSPGYYADIDAGCQAFHVCSEHEDIPHQSFLCPNGSIFNQEVFACDWWNNVDCAASETHYVRNNEIGVVGPSNSNKVPVRLKPENGQPQEVDINFQSQSSNDVEDSRQYLPPVNDNRKPIVPEYNGPPPFSVSTTRAPARTQQITARPTVARTQATTTYRPVTAEREYLPPVSVQENRRPIVQQQLPVQRTTQRPVQRVTQTNAPTTGRPTTEYLPPIQQTPQRIQPQPVQQRITQRPASPARTTQRPQVQQFVQSTTARPFLPIRVAEPAANQNFNIEGYNYNKPSINLETPNFDNRPATSQTYLPPVAVTQRPIQTFSASPRPVTQTAAPVRQAFSSTAAPARPTFSSVRQTPAPNPAPVRPTFAPVRQSPVVNQRPSFTETEGYNYPKPAVPVSTTRAPVRQTPPPVRQTPAPQRPSFSQTEGYNYPRPSVGLPAPTQPPVRQNFSPVRQTFTATPAPQTFSTIRQTPAPTPAPVRSTFAPVRQTPVVNQRPSFTENQGYNYPKPAVSTTQAPVRQTPAPQRPSFSQTQGYNYPKPSVGLPAQTQAPIRQTFAPVETTQRPVTTTRQPSVPTQAFDKNEGYSYNKPSVAFEFPSVNRVVTISAPTQPPVRQNFSPVRQNFPSTPAPARQSFTTVQQTPAPTLAPVRPTFAPARQSPVVNQRPSFTETQGYDYPKPAVGLPAPSTTQAPVRQTTSVAPQRPSFSQTQGYNYPKPSVGLPIQTQAPVRQTPAPVQQTFAPVRQTFAPVQQTFTSVRQTFAPVQQTFTPVRQTSAPVQQTFTPVRQTPAPQPSFSQTGGYNYPKPSVGLPAPTQAPVRQTFAPVTQRPTVVITTKQPSIPTQAFDKNEGYSYNKPSVSFELPVANKAVASSAQSSAFQQSFQSTISTTLKPQVEDHSIAIQQNYEVLSVKNQQSNQGYQYNLPAAAKAPPAPFSLKTNQQASSYIVPSPQPARVEVQPQFQQQVITSHHNCPNAPNAQLDLSQSAPFIAKGVSQEYLPPVETQSFVAQTSQHNDNDFNGYSYPKPKTPFITGNKAGSSFQQSSQQNNQFSQTSFTQRENNRNIAEDSFLRAFNAVSGNFQSQQDVKMTNEQQSNHQHHNCDHEISQKSLSGGARAATSSSSLSSSVHQIDIVPSISFSYQLGEEDEENKKAAAKASSEMSY